MKNKFLVFFLICLLLLPGVMSYAADTMPPDGPPPGGMAPPPGGASSDNSAEKFTYIPYWQENNVKTAVGGEILFFGDIHDLEDEYFYYDSGTGETKGVFTYLKDYDLHPGLYASQGDYLQQSSDLTANADAYYKSIDRIRAWAGDDAVIVSVMGNHENKTSAAEDLNGEQVFEQIVGNNNYGLIAKGAAADDPEKILYYVCGFGCAHADEYDKAGTRASAKNKYWVNPDAITALDRTLAAIYGEDGSRNIGIPTFIDAHLPIHYYTSERWAENSGELLDVLNKYPYVVYVWAHTHSEKDPYYGTIKLPGDTIIPYADPDALDTDGEPATEEICFTYVAGGAVRGNQISDNPMEDSERALYVRTDGSRIAFEYCGRDGKIFDRTQYTDIIDTTCFEDFSTQSAALAAGAVVDILEGADSSVVYRGDFFLARPIIGEEPLPAKEYSDRYSVETTWVGSNGNPVADIFSAGETYTAVLTLQAAEGISFDLTQNDVFLFDLSGTTIPARYITDKNVQIDGSTAVIRITFRTEPEMNATPMTPVKTVEQGSKYIIASDSEIYLSSCNTSDCICENGMMLTVPDISSYWYFEPVEGGWLLKNSNGACLTKEMNGMHHVLTPVKDPSSSEFHIWEVNDGVISMTADGTVYYLQYLNGQFALGTGLGENAARLYQND